ncbi:AraC-type helix-turn-helix domain-containing protein [Formosa agariphila KMM 3901]|uniref:AraC-type helix-turn-helix domain-containing protein n=1 Tax=Formosa agariphila (strain DSM 15362 / KCTC 12365 / LMG 23005 / KMM 3901 / M-2Alg 35-1) TaxID=1347342 RepID=T2KIH3_FORAG|nr:helix-turn-helix domain-containing protein [Formosa agariphila]CDF77774.1 AraC-type helix-turn-helix domain-containing protein [Formosa agariphila KMM 3901]
MKYALLILFSCIIYHQKDEYFKYSETFCSGDTLDISSENSLISMRVADSLFMYSKSDQNKMYALMLKSIVLEQEEKSGESIVFALKSLEMAKVENNYCLQSRIYTFLSRQYRKIGFVDRGKHFIAESFVASSKIPSKDHALKFITMANLELVEYNIEAGEYASAVEYLKSAIFILSKQEDEDLKYFDLANCEEKLARCFIKMNDDKSAISHFLEASSFIKQSSLGGPLLETSIYSGLVGLYLKQEQLDNAKVYVDKSLTIANQVNNNSIKEPVYKNVAEYYHHIEMLDSFKLYSWKYKKAIAENKDYMRELVNKASNELKEFSKEIPSQESSNSTDIIATIFMILIPSFGVYYKRKEVFNFVDNILIDIEKKVPGVTCSEKTEKILLDKLQEFETSNRFLDKNMSFPILVTQLNSNTKYLRQLLKVHKGSDFNTYINRLRILYIINKLNTNSDYLNYKISYLAEESGFSSHSQFSTNFKKFTNNSPSDYINTLKNKIAS